MGPLFIGQQIALVSGVVQVEILAAVSSLFKFQKEEECVRCLPRCSNDVVLSYFSWPSCDGCVFRVVNFKWDARQLETLPR